MHAHHGPLRMHHDPPNDPIELLHDYGHYGAVASISFERFGTPIDRLAAATHALRKRDFAEARGHADLARIAMPSSIVPAFFATLVHGTMPFGGLSVAIDALATLERAAPNRVVSHRCLAAMVFIHHSMATEATASIDALARIDANEARVAALRALVIARCERDIARAGAMLAPHAAALRLSFESEEDLGHEYHARWCFAVYDFAARQQSLNAIADRHRTSLSITIAIARDAIHDANGLRAATAIEEHLAAGGVPHATLCGLYGRAKLLYAEYDAAIAAIRDAFAMDQRDITEAERADWLSTRAEALMARGEHHGAALAFDDAIRRAPRRAALFLRRAAARSALDRPLDAAKDLRAALALQPLDCPESILGELAQCYFNARRYDEAARGYERAAREALRCGLAPEALAHHEAMRGASLHFLGRYEDAIEAYHRALSAQPTLAKALSDRAEALLELARDEAAMEDLERAIAGGYDESSAHRARGRYLQRIGEHARAIKAFDRALLRDPLDVEALEARASSLEALDDLRRAAQDRERCAVLRAARQR
jgi:tetratricopeptide (TPR) repeat protein